MTSPRKGFRVRHESDLETMWRDVLTNPHSPFYKYGRIRKHIPGSPRCKLPLGSVATPFLKLTGRGPSRGNSRFCNDCEQWEATLGDAEVELTLLFADVRGSTGLAEKLGPREFAGLMQRFYRASTRVTLLDPTTITGTPARRSMTRWVACGLSRKHYRWMRTAMH